MKVLSLTPPYYGDFNKDDPKALAYIAELNEVYNAITNGTAYIRYLDGDRKGSIARVKWRSKLDKDNMHEDRPRIDRSRWGGYRFISAYFFVIASWDNRRNKIQETFPNSNIEVLLDYDGPTIWEKFDHKVAKEKALSSITIKDVAGNSIVIGDQVIYMNLRYGQGGRLDFGSIKEFKASVNYKLTEISVVVESNDGELSTIRYPQSMIWKIGE